MAQRLPSPQGKAQYSKPKLAIYGEFANLTASGLGSLSEGMTSNQGSMRFL